MLEVWLPVSGYEGVYIVSNFGNIKRVSYKRNRTPKEHKQSVDKGNGYKRVGLWVDGKCKTIFMHRVVAMAFHPNLYFDGAQVNHKNANKTDNSAENLEWVTQQQNIDHSVLNNLRPTGDKCGPAKYPDRYSGDNHWTRRFPHRVKRGYTYILVGGKRKRCAVTTARE